MTVEELLESLNIQVYHFEKVHNKTLKFELKFEYEHVTPYPYEDGISTYEKDITEIEINNETRTITFKGESK